MFITPFVYYRIITQIVRIEIKYIICIMRAYIINLLKCSRRNYLICLQILYYIPAFQHVCNIMLIILNGRCKFGKCVLYAYILISLLHIYIMCRCVMGIAEKKIMTWCRCIGGASSRCVGQDDNNYFHLQLQFFINFFPVHFLRPTIQRK